MNYKLPNELLKNKRSANEIVSFRATPETKERIENIAKSNKITKTDVLEIAINQLYLSIN